MKNSIINMKMMINPDLTQEKAYNNYGRTS